MRQSNRTTPRNHFEHERVVAVIFRLIVTGIIILVLSRVGSAVSSLSTDFAGVVSAVE